MIGALYFLLFNSWKNRLVMRVRRLKQPKYLFGAIVGGLYFYAYFFRYLFNAKRLGSNGAIHLTAENMVWLEPLGTALMFAVVVMAWIIPHGRGALIFTEAEIAFLLPAPISRRTLIHFKLLKSQTRILFTVLFFMFFMGRFMSGGVAWVHAMGWWVILSTLSLHFMGSSFARTMMIDRGLTTWKRRTLMLTILTALVVATVMWARQTIPAPDPASIHGASDLEYYLEHALNAGPAAYLLYPFRLLVRPYLQPDLGSFLLAVWPALIVMALHYLWVVRANVAFEEASIDASKKMAERVATMRANRQLGVRKPTKKKRAPFKLLPVGIPSVGFLWKNLIGAGQAFTLRFWLMLLWIGVIAGLISSSHHGSSNIAMFLAFLSLIFLLISFFVGPQLVRQDFRQDLSMADVLKTYPLKGWQVAFGELLTPAVILTCLQWLLILVSLSTSAWLPEQHLGSISIGLGIRILFACGVAIIAPGLNFVTLLIPNAAVLLFPGWFQAGKDAPQGIEATGQRLIFVFGQLFVFVIALAPAAVVSGSIYFLINYFIGIYAAVPLAAVGAAVILCGEASAGIWWLGRCFEKYDVAGE